MKKFIKSIKLAVCAILFLGGQPLMISDQDTVFYNLIGIAAVAGGAYLYCKWNKEYLAKGEEL